MAPQLSVRTFEPGEWRTYRDVWLRALADSPDAFGSRLAVVQGHPDDWWTKRLAQVADPRRDLALVATASAAAGADWKPIGLAWGKIEESTPKVAHIYHMWVAPEYRGQGTGRRLLETVISWARDAGARTLNLGTTYGDTPAIRLYTRAGFKPLGPPQPCRPGSDLLGLEMELDLSK